MNDGMGDIITWVRLTVAHDAAIGCLGRCKVFGPPRQIREIESEIVGLRQRIEVAGLF